MKVKEKINKINFLRKKIKNKPSIGSWIQFNSTSVIELMCTGKFDWLCLDMEHGELRTSDLIKNIVAIENQNKLAFVRLAVSNEENCKTALESGASGIIFPNLKNCKEVEKILQFTDYKNSRGSGFSRCNTYGEEFKTNLNFKPFNVVMIENTEIVKDLNNVLKIKKIDAFLVGPYDLYNSYINSGGKKKNFNRYLNKMVLTLKKSKKIYGIHIVNPHVSNLKKRISQGYKFLPFGIDSTFLIETLKNIKI